MFFFFSYVYLGVPKKNVCKVFVVGLIFWLLQLLEGRMHERVCMTWTENYYYSLTSSRASRRISGTTLRLHNNAVSSKFVCIVVTPYFVLIYSIEP